MANFWVKLKKPFFILAPMDDVTDTVFRQMVGKIAKPDVFFTEFTNVDGLQSPGRKAVVPRLKYSESEHPIVAQIWGLNPENFYQSAKDIKKMGFDGIDINMGCPESGVIKKGACSALINNHKLAQEIIEATIKGAGSLPVSVKTRLGFESIQTEEWIGFLLGFSLAAIIIHGRTAQEMSKVPAHWDEIAKAVKLRNQLGVQPLIIGNGDILDYRDGLKKTKQTGVDGVMIGRGIFQNVWTFEPTPKKHTLNENLKLLLEHARLFDQIWGKSKNFLDLRKFFKAYVHGFEGANDLRNKLLQSNSASEVENIVRPLI